jgi:hypothetical protein
MGIGLTMARRQPDPAGQLGRAGEAADVADSATSTDASTGPSPSMAWIARVAAMAGQPGRDHAAKQGDLGVQRLQQPPQRVDPRGEGGRQLEVVQQLGAGLAE